MRRSKYDGGNEGIQAANVTAEVLAVGRGAKAAKHVRSNAEQTGLTAAVTELRQAVAELALQPRTRQTIEADVSRLENGKNAPPDAATFAHTLRSLVSKLKAAGVVVSDVSSLAGPIMKIAALAKLAGKFF